MITLRKYRVTTTLTTITSAVVDAVSEEDAEEQFSELLCNTEFDADTRIEYDESEHTDIEVIDE